MTKITDWIKKVEEYDRSALVSQNFIQAVSSATSKTEDRPKPSVLPTDSTERNQLPMMTGCVDYFPAALAEIARVSFIGNEQHNPGQPMHWAREKSTEHADKAMRHLAERGGFDSDGSRHTAKAGWRILALLQEELEAAGAKPGRASVWATKEKS
jgi:hypothetical protein